MKSNILLALALFLAIPFANGQTETKELKTEISAAKKIGRVAMRDVIIQNQDGVTATRKKSRRDYKIPKNFIGRFPRNVDTSNEYKIDDPVRQSEVAPLRRKPAQIRVNVPGLTAQFRGTPITPSDPSGDAGFNHYMQAVNATTVGIYTKTGMLLDSINMTDFWEERSSEGDPIILFDQEARRWFITEFPDGDELLIAVSESEDPYGMYNQYIFSTPNFPDYPKYAIWPGSLVVSTNEFSLVEVTNYFIDLEALYAGEEEPTVIRTTVPKLTNLEQGFQVNSPVDWSGIQRPPADRGPIILSLQDKNWGVDPTQTEDAVLLRSTNVDYAQQTATYSETLITLSEFDAYPCFTGGPGFACAPQQGGPGLDIIPEIIYFQPHYRNFGTHESIVFTFVTDVTAGDDIAGVRWTELRKTQGEEWDVYQEGTFAPDDGLHRYMACIAMDGNGNIGMTYNTSSEDSFADWRMTGRKANDPLGQMTEPEVVLVEGKNLIRSGGRFGDYGHMTIDPADDITFWSTSEYADNGMTATRILAFTLDKAEFDIFPLSLFSPKDSDALSNSESIVVEIQNNGKETISNFKIGYQIEGGPKVEETINISLAPDNTYAHTFQQTGDFSEIRSYDLKLFTSADEDVFISNDTLYPILTKLPQFDASLAAIRGVELACGSSDKELMVEILNEGTQIITDAILSYSLNGNPSEELVIQGSIIPGEIKLLPLSLTDLETGTQSLSVSIEQVNGRADQNPSNNLLETEFPILAGDFASVTLEILTDDYPEETTWELIDASGDVIADSDGILSGQQTLLTTEFCLDPNGCYVFKIYDLFGDGLAADGDPEGSYRILDEDGNVLAGILQPDFGDEEVNGFCPSKACNLSADYVVQDGQNGSILIEVTSGVGPISYSIDGVSFTDDNLFSNLQAGDYTVVVMDGNGCQISEEISLTTTSTTDFGKDVNIKLFPNPTDGLFTIEMNGLQSEELFIPVQIYDNTGKMIQSTTITRYDNNYKGMVSLYHYPAGNYLVRISEEDKDLLLPIIKE